MKLFGILIFALGLIQCASMKFEQNPPFIIKSASYTYTVGGMPGSSSTKLAIEYSSDKKINFDSIYFFNKATKAFLETKNSNLFVVGKFNSSKVNNKRDLILHSDPAKEFGNKPAVNTTQKIPFELKENEAVLSYKENDRVYYVKIDNITENKSTIRQ